MRRLPSSSKPRYYSYNRTPFNIISYLFVRLISTVFLISQGTTRRLLNTMPPPSRIDTHAHFVPPIWRENCLANGFEHPDGIPAIPVRELSPPISHLPRPASIYESNEPTAMVSRITPEADGRYRHLKVHPQHNITRHTSCSRQRDNGQGFDSQLQRFRFKPEKDTPHQVWVLGITPPP